MMALGLTVVLVMGDFDLSVSGMVAVASAVVVAIVVRTDIPWGVAILIAAGVALVVGVFNGVLVAYVGTPSFITTLATGVMLAGVELAVTGPGTTFISGGTDIPRSYRNLGIGEPLLQIKSPVWIAIGLAIVLWLLLTKTEVGRFMYAIGGNPEAARLSGIPVKFLRASGFVVVALCALAAGIVASARTGSHVRNVGGSLLLPAFAAAFLGATMSKRGQFIVLGTVVGAVFLQVVESGLTFMGYDQDVKNLVKGAILIAAMLLGRVRRIDPVTHPDGDAFLEIRGIRKEYPGVLAVDDVSLAFEAGTIVGLVGKNGAGKSTVIKIMAGAIQPDRGEIRPRRRTTSSSANIRHHATECRARVRPPGSLRRRLTSRSPRT